MYFNKCTFCGSNNDPGEVCDCIKYKNKIKSKLNDEEVKEKQGNFQRKIGLSELSKLTK